jgi:hypothetical protein
MSKTFATAPKPGSREAIEAYERGGPGHDTKTQKHIATPVALKRLSINMPADLHIRFKVACARAQVMMADEVLAFIERRAAELEGTGP